MVGRHPGQILTTFTFFMFFHGGFMLFYGGSSPLFFVWGGLSWVGRYPGAILPSPNQHVHIGTVGPNLVPGCRRPTHDVSIGTIGPNSVRGCRPAQPRTCTLARLAPTWFRDVAVQPKTRALARLAPARFRDVAQPNPRRANWHGWPPLGSGMSPSPTQDVHIGTVGPSSA